MPQLKCPVTSWRPLGCSEIPRALRRVIPPSFQELLCPQTVFLFSLNLNPTLLQLGFLLIQPNEDGKGGDIFEEVYHFFIIYEKRKARNA